ncbi:helix-turn-helix transcriptional regulator [Thalassospira marina]|uniref:Uncharacterized protein n=1 Tax=Thalassospira marina TaxID=2048283 RepID=A0A2N3KMS0_9PROT|nr:helix-turn-helix transcriptional regulator [Thalassospira marina]PKR51773.1 hypothetical protein COO20_18135 [Thalassospira marina]
MSTGSFQQNLEELRLKLAEDRAKISAETGEIYKEIAASEAKSSVNRPISDQSAYIARALKAERKLGQLAERFRDPVVFQRCQLAAALLEACETVTAEGRGATPRRLLQFLAYEGDASSHYENLIGAMDVFMLHGLPIAPEGNQLSEELVETLAIRASLRSRNWLAPQDMTTWEDIIANRHVPCPVDSETISRFINEIREIPSDSGLIGAADAIYIVSKLLRELNLEGRDIGDPGLHSTFQLETNNPQAIYWNRIARALPRYLMMHFCDGIKIPVMCGHALTDCQVKLRPLIDRGVTPEDARTHTINVLAAGLEKLEQTERLLALHWQKAEKLSSEGRGTSIGKICEWLFEKGAICSADIVDLCDLTPQAAHYQIKRLLNAGILTRGARGKVGGHYFLDVLLQL